MLTYRNSLYVNYVIYFEKIIIKFYTINCYVVQMIYIYPYLSKRFLNNIKFRFI